MSCLYEYWHHDITQESSQDGPNICWFGPRRITRRLTRQILMWYRDVLVNPAASQSKHNSEENSGPARDISQLPKNTSADKNTEKKNRKRYSRNPLLKSLGFFFIPRGRSINYIHQFLPASRHIKHLNGSKVVNKHKVRSQGNKEKSCLVIINNTVKNLVESFSCETCLVHVIAYESGSEQVCHWYYQAGTSPNSCLSQWSSSQLQLTERHDGTRQRRLSWFTEPHQTNHCLNTHLTLYPLCNFDMSVM